MAFYYMIQTISMSPPQITSLKELHCHRSNMEPWTELNFLLYCAKYYNNPQCFDTQEFNEDLNRIKYIKRLFNKYRDDNDLKDRLILNHIIVLCNVFGPIHASRILFFKLKDFHSYLKPFLEYLGYLPAKITNIGFFPQDIICADIESDKNIQDALDNI